MDSALADVLVRVVAAVTPLGSVTSDITTYILGYGPIGIGLVLAGAAAFKGWQLMSPARRTALRDEARADLAAENARLIAELARTQEQRDDALKIAQTQVVPLLVSFTATTQGLLPLLQDLISMREELRRARPRSPGR